MQSSQLFFMQTRAVAQRLLLEQWRQKRGLIFWAVFPSTMMLLFGLVYAHNASMRAGLDAAAAGILIGAALFFSCLGGTVAVIAAERERGTLPRLLTTPLHPYTRALRAAVPELGVGRPPSTSMLTVGPPQTSSVHLPVGQGCSYADRCPLAVEICRSQTPVLREVAGREIACHRAEDSLSL